MISKIKPIIRVSYLEVDDILHMLLHLMLNFLSGLLSVISIKGKRISFLGLVFFLVESCLNLGVSHRGFVQQI